MCDFKEGESIFVKKKRGKKFYYDSDLDSFFSKKNNETERFLKPFF